MFRAGDGSDMSEEDFKKAAEQYNGDECLVVPGSGKPMQPVSHPLCPGSKTCLVLGYPLFLGSKRR